MTRPSSVETANGVVRPAGINGTIIVKFKFTQEFISTYTPVLAWCAEGETWTWLSRDLLKSN